MTTCLSIERDLRLRPGGRGQRQGLAGTPSPPAAVPAGRVPRVARLMALALRFEEQIRQGQLGSYAAVAALGHVSRARISQIMNLLQLAPEIQEALLFLPRTQRGRDPIHLRQLQPIAATLAWEEQRRLWHELLEAARGPAEATDGRGQESRKTAANPLAIVPAAR
jgi:hypothetical protein